LAIRNQALSPSFLKNESGATRLAVIHMEYVNGTAVDNEKSPDLPYAHEKSGL
jgi:hypothetical protein